MGRGGARTWRARPRGRPSASRRRPCWRRRTTGGWPPPRICSTAPAILVLVPPPRRLRRAAGARAQFSIGSFAVQPSEFAKIVLILALARYLSRGGRLAAVRLLPRRRPAPRRRPGRALILREPDLGTALVFAPVHFGDAPRRGRPPLLPSPGSPADGPPLPPRRLAAPQAVPEAPDQVFLDPAARPAARRLQRDPVPHRRGGRRGMGGRAGSTAPKTHLRFLPEQHRLHLLRARRGGGVPWAAPCCSRSTRRSSSPGLRIAEQARDEFGEAGGGRHHGAAGGPRGDQHRDDDRAAPDPPGLRSR